MKPDEAAGVVGRQRAKQQQQPKGRQGGVWQQRAVELMWLQRRRLQGWLDERRPSEMATKSSILPPPPHYSPTRSSLLAAHHHYYFAGSRALSVLLEPLLVFVIDPLRLRLRRHVEPNGWPTIVFAGR